MRGGSAISTAKSSAVAHLLLAQKRRWREHPEEEASGPLVVDLDDVARHRSTCAVCSEQASGRVQRDSLTPLPKSSLFEDFEWGGPTTQYLAEGTAAERPWAARQRRHKERTSIVRVVPLAALDNERALGDPRTGAGFSTLGLQHVRTWTSLEGGRQLVDKSLV